jgi:hypothetical protein
MSNRLSEEANPEADASRVRSTKRFAFEATFCTGALRCSILDVVMHG